MATQIILLEPSDGFLIHDEYEGRSQPVPRIHPESELHCTLRVARDEFRWVLRLQVHITVLVADFDCVRLLILEMQ